MKIELKLSNRERDRKPRIFGDLLVGGESRWPSTVPTCWWVWVDQCAHLCTRVCVFSCVCFYIGQQGYASSVSVLGQMVPERRVDPHHYVNRPTERCTKKVYQISGKHCLLQNKCHWENMVWLQNYIKANDARVHKYTWKHMVLSNPLQHSNVSRSGWMGTVSS